MTLRLLEKTPTIIHPNTIIELEDLTRVAEKWIHKVLVTTDTEDRHVLFYFVSTGQHPSMKSIIDKIIPKYRNAHTKSVLGNSQIKGVSILESKPVTVNQVYVAKEEE